MFLCIELCSEGTRGLILFPSFAYSANFDECYHSSSFAFFAVHEWLLCLWDMMQILLECKHPPKSALFLNHERKLLHFSYSAGSSEWYIATARYVCETGAVYFHVLHKVLLKSNITAFNRLHGQNRWEFTTVHLHCWKLHLMYTGFGTYVYRYALRCLSSFFNFQGDYKILVFLNL